MADGSHSPRVVSSTGGATLPSPWAHRDIGAVGVQGNASQASGAYTVQESGNYGFPRPLTSTVAGHCELEIDGTTARLRP
jgi:hypothetical protein